MRLICRTYFYRERIFWDHKCFIHLELPFINIFQREKIVLLENLYFIGYIIRSTNGVDSKAL